MLHAADHADLTHPALDLGRPSAWTRRSTQSATGTRRDFPRLRDSWSARPLTSSRSTMLLAISRALGP